MKDFYALLANNGHPVPNKDDGTFNILSVTAVSNGYILVTLRTWTDGSVIEHAFLVIEEKHGPNEGKYRLGWQHKIFEHYVEQD